MTLTLIICTVIIIVAVVFGIIQMNAEIETQSEILKEEHQRMLDELEETLKVLCKLEHDTKIAINRLPVSRSKKAQKEIEESETEEINEIVGE